MIESKLQEYQINAIEYSRMTTVEYFYKNPDNLRHNLEKLRKPKYEREREYPYGTSVSSPKRQDFWQNVDIPNVTYISYQTICSFKSNSFFDYNKL